MACYAYEVLDEPIMSDTDFDELGNWLADWGDCMAHPHVGYIDLDACRYTSAVKVPYHELPLLVLTATHNALGSTLSTSPIYTDALKALKGRLPR